MNNTNTPKRLDDMIKFVVVDNNKHKFVKAIMELDEFRREQLIDEYHNKMFSFYDSYDFSKVADDTLKLPETITSTITWDTEDTWDVERYKANARQSVLNKYYQARVNAIYRFRNEVGKRVCAVTTPMIKKNENILLKHPFKWQ